MKAANVFACLGFALIALATTTVTASAQSPLFAEFISPATAAVPSLTQEVKPGAVLQITGFATGPGFQGYVLEWAPGAAATSGWSTAGIVLDGNGLAPVNPGSLGTWTSAATAQGYYTLRLTVNNGTFFSVATTTVYFEAALVSAVWPKFVGEFKFDHGAQPVRQADGSTRLLVGGFRHAGGSTLYSYGADGSVITAPLDFGSENQASVGDLDGLAGDEVVVADGRALKIFSSNLVLLNTITTPEQRVFWVDQPLLVDIDGDGVKEIVAVARATDSPDGTSYRTQSGGYLYVFRMDGTLYSNIFPVFLAATISNGGLGAAGAKFAAADLNGDGKKEIIVAMDSNGTPGHTLRLVSPDGLLVNFATPTTLGWIVESVSVADLDHDGTNEIVIAESTSDQSAHRIRVLNNDGNVRAGWPVTLSSNISLAIGDLYRDQKNEIVAAANQTLTILNGDGGVMSQSSIGDGTNGVTNSTPLIADIDGDGLPEILLASTTFANSPVLHHVSFLTRYLRDGGLQQSWPLFGLNGRQPFIGVPAVGDFNGDGKTDIAVQISLIDGGGLGGATTVSGLTWLTTGTNFGATASPWTTNFRDPQNSRALSPAGALPLVPLITTQPLSRTVAVGYSTTFFGFAVGNPDPTYRWQKNGVYIPGAVGPLLTLDNVQPAASGTYRIVATNANGSTFSNGAVLTVATMPVMTSQPSSRTVNVGANVTLSCTVTGTPTPTFQWWKDDFTLISGATSSSLVLTNVQLTDAGSYRVTAGNFAGTVSSIPAILTVNQAPYFTIQPPPAQYMMPGVDHSFFVLATGTPAPTYQWQKNGVNIAGATSSRLDLPNVQSTDGGTYRAIATNSVKSVASTNMVLTVVVTPVFTKQPVGKTVTSGTSLTLSVTVTGTPTPFLQWQKDGVVISGATSASLTLVNVQPADSGSYSVSAWNFGPTVVSNPAVVTVNALPVITTQPVSQTVLAGDSVTFTADATGTPSPSVRWQKNGVNITGATSTTLSLTNVLVSAAGTYRMIATNAAGSATSAGAVLTVNAPPVITVQPAGKTVLQGATVTFSVTATGTPAPAYQWLKGGAILDGATARTLTLTNVQPSDTAGYQVRVTNVVDSVLSNGALLNVNVPPTITTQPMSQSVFTGDDASFTVIATGIPDPTYRWQKNGVTISGATGATYSVLHSTLSGAGTYRVIVTNAAGSVTSADAVLVVNSAPVFTTQPVNKTVNADTTVTFTAAAIGFPAPTYQWRKDQVEIPGATSPTLTLNQVQLGDAGSYDLMATNVFSITISHEAVLIVKSKPVFVTQPESQSVSVGNGVNFYAVANANPSATYKWQKNGVTIPGATGASFAINFVQLSDAGNYTLLATNSLGATTSATAVLTVLP